jgi:hypothetical protein
MAMMMTEFVTQHDMFPLLRSCLRNTVTLLKLVYLDTNPAQYCPTKAISYRYPIVPSQNVFQMNGRAAKMWLEQSPCVPCMDCYTFSIITAGPRLTYKRVSDLCFSSSILPYNHNLDSARQTQRRVDNPKQLHIYINQHTAFRHG